MIVGITRDTCGTLVQCHRVEREGKRRDESVSNDVWCDVMMMYVMNYAMMMHTNAYNAHNNVKLLKSFDKGYANKVVK